MNKRFRSIVSVVITVWTKRRGERPWPLEVEPPNRPHNLRGTRRTRRFPVSTKHDRWQPPTWWTRNVFDSNTTPLEKRKSEENRSNKPFSAPHAGLRWEYRTFVRSRSRALRACSRRLTRIERELDVHPSGRFAHERRLTAPMALRFEQLATPSPRSSTSVYAT